MKKQKVGCLGPVVEHGNVKSRLSYTKAKGFLLAESVLQLANLSLWNTKLWPIKIRFFKVVAAESCTKH